MLAPSIRRRLGLLRWHWAMQLPCQRSLGHEVPVSSCGRAEAMPAAGRPSRRLAAMAIDPASRIGAHPFEGDTPGGASAWVTSTGLHHESVALTMDERRR